MTVLEKTPCASAALAFFGVTGVTWNNRTKLNVWEGTLRRNGFAVRSRMSKLNSKENSVGNARAKLATVAAQEPAILAFVVRVDGHVLVVARDGRTVVDADPRQRDRRKVRGVYAIMRM